MHNFMMLTKFFNESQLSTFEIIIGAILIVAALLIIFVVLLQEGRQANVGVISGAADSFMDKGAAKSLDQKLSKWTKVIAIVFFLLVLGGMMVSKFFTNEAKNARLREEAQKTATSASVTAQATTTTTTGAATSSTSAAEASASASEDASATEASASADATDATNAAE